MTCSDILELPVSERLHLLEMIWDSLIEVPETIPVSDEVRAELDRRLEAYIRNPETARPWAEVRDELFRDKVSLTFVAKVS